MYKVKVSVNDVPYNGYINIDPSPDLSTENARSCEVLIGNPTDLSQIEDGTCNELLIRDYIDHLNVSNLYAILSIWCKKIRKNGTLTISGTDFDSLVRAYLNGTINLKDVNDILFGTYKTAWDMKSICINHAHVTDIIKDCGLNIKSVERINYKYIITAIKK